MSAVLDVNVVVAAVIAPNGATRRVLAYWEAQRFSLLVSEGIIAEIEEKLSDPKIGGKYSVTKEDVGNVIRLQVTQAEIIALGPGNSCGLLKPDLFKQGRQCLPRYRACHSRLDNARPSE